MKCIMHTNKKLKARIVVNLSIIKPYFYINNTYSKIIMLVIVNTYYNFFWNLFMFTHNYNYIYRVYNNIHILLNK